METAIVLPQELIIGLIRLVEEIKTSHLQQSVGINKSEPDYLLSEAQAQQYLRCSLSKIQILRKGGYLEYHQIGRRIFYSKEALGTYLSKNIIKTKLYE